METFYGSQALRKLSIHSTKMVFLYAALIIIISTASASCDFPFKLSAFFSRKRDRLFARIGRQYNLELTISSFPRDRMTKGNEVFEVRRLTGDVCGTSVTIQDQLGGDELMRWSVFWWDAYFQFGRNRITKIKIDQRIIDLSGLDFLFAGGRCFASGRAIQKELREIGQRN